MRDEDFGDKAPEGAHGSGQVGHVSVLLKEAIDFLAIRRGGTYIDATLGLGGHSLEIARRLGPQGRLIGFDKDPQALELARKRLASLEVEREGEQPRMTLLHSSYADLARHVPPKSADGLLADLGVSSLQFDDASLPTDQGTLQSLSIGSNGRLQGSFSSGKTLDLAAIPLSAFNGDNFLQRGDGETFTPTLTSGAAQANASGRLVGNALEASNTDVAGQFTTMIMTQQAYSANTKVVTTTDQMLQTVTNMTV